jgi:hypothetical protein
MMRVSFHRHHVGHFRVDGQFFTSGSAAEMRLCPFLRHNSASQWTDEPGIHEISLKCSRQCLWLGSCYNNKKQGIRSNQTVFLRNK